MPWVVEDKFRVKLGGNTYIDTPVLIAYKGQSLFTLKRRDGDQTLGIDFDIFDKSGKRIATIRNGNIVQGNKGDYEIMQAADHYTLTQKATGRVVCDIRKGDQTRGAELEVSVDMFTPSGFHLQATPIGTNLPGGTFITGSTIQSCGCGISVN